MFRIPILIALAGITGLFLYKNEKARVPVQIVQEESQQQQMLGRDPLPQVSELDTDEYDSDESVTLSELNLRGD